ncbi:lysosomal amino acid transporter 1 homolog [Tubulanus polymorphus]|uniref:lysosomal amino acid transporter 1 homolog n=1 Tax=Tubulanus polymorphus TaxID=672921 RepID=UPI003DA32203
MYFKDSSYFYGDSKFQNLTIENCTDGVPWIKTVLKQCVLDDLRYASVLVGLGSTLVSFINCVPQVYTNCVSGIPHKALSLFLIIQWLLGDSLNLIGCILSHQLPVQVVYAVFMVGMDITLLTQYFFFKIKESINGPKPLKVTTDFVDKQSQTYHSINSAGQYRQNVYCITVLWGVSFISMNMIGSVNVAPDFIVKHSPAGRSLLMQTSSVAFFRDRTDAIGFGIGVASTCFYIGSRMPQIYKNWSRKSTEGVNKFLFILMVLSNILYSGAIFLQSTELRHILHSMPWIVGSAGMITFDTVILMQFYKYRRNVPGLVDNFSTDSERSPLLA